MTPDRIWLTSRIEDLLDELNFTGQVNLESLRQSISTAISASEELDAKVERTLSRLRKLLPKRPHRSLMGKLTRHLAFLEHGCHGGARNMEVWSEDSEQFPSVRPPHFPPVKNHKAIEKLLKEIRVINKKKQGFEGGFISEDGIKVGGVFGEALTGRTASGTSIRGWRRVCGSGTALRPYVPLLCGRNPVLTLSSLR